MLKAAYTRGSAQLLLHRVQSRALSNPSGAVPYADAYAGSLEDPEAFWGEAAKAIYWHRSPHAVLQKPHPSTSPFYSWFPGGTTNTAYNALDVHCESGRQHQAALLYESAATGESRSYTYAQLLSEVNTMAGVLRHHGVGVGDRVLLSCSMVPETAITMLACARIGAIHTVVFGGFAAAELAVRIQDTTPKLVVATSCGLEGNNKVVPYAPLIHRALDIASATHRVGGVVMIQRPQHRAELVPGRDFDYEDEMRHVRSRGLFADPVWVPSEHPLYILGTSGSTGRPKQVVRDTGGHAVALKHAMHATMGMQPGDAWGAFSDMAWILGHTKIVYAPLLLGCSTLVFEGKPVGMPDAGTYWRVAQKHNLAGMFMAPTAARAMKREDPHGELLRRHLPSKLRSLFLAGERCDVDTLHWLQSSAGESVVVSEQWWQTELGYPCLAIPRGFADATPLPVKSGFTGVPMPGWDVRVLRADAMLGGAADASDAHASSMEYFSSLDSSTTATTAATDASAATGQAPGTPALSTGHHATLHPAPHAPDAEHNQLGPLVIRLPMPPGSLLTLWGDEPRFRSSYTDPIAGYVMTGDVAYRDEHGYISVIGRVDDVINVAGHRLSTGAIEAAVAGHPDVAETAVVGVADPLKGQMPLALVVLKVDSAAAVARGGIYANTTGRPSVTSTSEQALIREVRQAVRDTVGPIATLAGVLICNRLPKTRSGKILRSTIRSIADGTSFKTPSTIEDEAVLAEMKELLGEWRRAL